MTSRIKKIVPPFDVHLFLAKAGTGKTLPPFGKGERIFAQGDNCDSILSIHGGTVKLTVVSKRGKEATIAILSAGDFVREECIATVQRFRSATATAVTTCSLLQIQNSEMQQVLRDEPELSAAFVA